MEQQHTEQVPREPVEPWQVWKHRDGDTYGVICLSNMPGTRPGYPVRVVYFNMDNFKVYDRDLSDWHRSMTLLHGMWVGTLFQEALLESLGLPYSKP